MPANNENLWVGIFVEIHLPISTPTIVEQIKAKALPTKTTIGCPDSADNISVAI